MAARGSLRFVIDDLRRFTADQVQALGLAIHANLTETTPVDTGWARSNWQMSAGSPIESTLGLPGTSGVPPLVVGYQLRQGPIYITNNVPYIQRLNEGYSQQAPAGFVQAAIERGVGEARRKRGMGRTRTRAR